MQKRTSTNKASVKKEHTKPKEKQADPPKVTHKKSCESISMLCGIFSPRTIFFTLIAFLFFVILWETMHTGPCNNILYSTPENLTNLFCPSKFPKSDWDKSYNFFAEEINPRLFGAVSAVFWVLSLLVGVLLPTKSSLLAAIIDFVFGTIAFGSSLTFVVAFSRIVREYDSFPCTDILDNAFKIVFSENVCTENYTYALSFIDFEKVKSAIVGHPVFEKLFSAHNVDFALFTTKLIGESKDYIPYFFIAFGVLLLIKQTQKLFYKLCFLSSFVIPSVLVGLFVINNKENLSQDIMIQSIVLFVGLVGLFLIAILFFTVAFSVVSLWGLVVGALLIPLKFSYIFPDLHWVYPIMIGSFCLKWIISEPSNLLIFEGSYLLWQGVALILRRDFTLEWLFLIFMVATIYHNVFEQRKAGRLNLRLKLARERKAKEAEAKKKN